MLFEKDDKIFIERTRKALKQHVRNLAVGEISYDRTLFINACVGLLLVPNATIYDELPNIPINEWGISADKIRMKDGDGNELDELKTVQEVVRHLRNAIAHNRFDFNSGNNVESIPIDNINFIDINHGLYKRRKHHKEKVVAEFGVELTYEEFKQFIEKVADFAIDHIPNKLR